jgi:probable selenium-dependent hydroxylase accessory protein YqeC
MIPGLGGRMGIREHELISIVGAGGKTTVLHALGRELAADGRRVILTTTTKMAADQVTEPVCVSAIPDDIEAAYVRGAALFVMSDVDAYKPTGFGPDTVNLLFADTSVDHLIVEADGARSMSIKAPADHEPAIPSRSTLVIVVVGADALGKPLIDVGHRPDRIAELTGASVNDIVTAERAAAVLLHPEGGLKDIPENARIVMAITKSTSGNIVMATELAAILEKHPRVDRCLMLDLS